MKLLFKCAATALYILAAGQPGSAQSLIEIPQVQSYQLIADGSGSGPSLSTGDQFGRSVASIGDINNDGINDMAVGAPLDDLGGTNRGAVYICFMNANGTVKTSPAPVKIGHGSAVASPSGTLSLTNSEAFGNSVAGIGDVNGDGYEDIAVGAIGATAVAKVCGAVYVVFLDNSANILSYKRITEGSAGFPNTLPNNARFGGSLANAGDLNNDGENDLIVGAYDVTSNYGTAYIIRLKSNGEVKSSVPITDNTGGLPSGTLTIGDEFGFSVAGCGDLNYDGIRDIVVGARGDDDGYMNSGAFWILYLDTTSNVDSEKKLSYPLMSNHYYPNIAPVGLGESVSVTDINEDGITDFVVGVKGFNSNKGGFYFMVLDSAQNIKAMKLTSFKYGWANAGPATSPQYGIGICEVQLSGNLFHKQYLVGANLYDPGSSSQEGSVYVMTMDSLHFDFSAGDILDYTAVSNFSGDFTATLTNGDLFGVDAAVIGDLNNDGVDDLVVGANGDDSNSELNSGAVYVLFMKADGRVDTYQKIAEGIGNLGNPLDANDQFGHGVAPAGDWNNDGFEDVFVGAIADDDGGTDRGAVYLLFLDVNGQVLSSPAKVKITNTSDNDFFGIDIDTIGDLDNDGVNDLVVGVYQNDDGGTNRGAVDILFMNSNATVKARQRISDTQGGFNDTLVDNDLFGTSVDGIGDFDGDGVEDIAVGSNRGGIGAAYIIYLNTNGTVKDYVKYSNSMHNFPHTLIAGQLFGQSVQMVPDMDGNGVRDLMICSAGYKTYTLSRGGVWIAFLDSLANVIDTKIITDSSGKLYTNMNDVFTTGYCTRYAGLDSLGNLKMFFGTRDDGGGTDRGGLLALTLHVFSSPSYSQLQNYYAELEKKLDGENYVFFDKRVRFRYYDKYHDSDSKLSFKIYNAVGTIVYSDLGPGALLDPAYGENRFYINCGPAGGNLPYGNYVLEVINTKRESYFMRFQLSNPASSIKK